MLRLSKADETKIAKIVKDLGNCQIFEEEEQLWMGLLYIINQAIIDNNKYPAPCSSCANLHDILQHEMETAARFQHVLEEIVDTETELHERISNVGGNPEESFACKLARDTLSSYAVRREQFNKRGNTGDIEVVLVDAISEMAKG